MRLASAMAIILLLLSTSSADRPLSGEASLASAPLGLAFSDCTRLIASMTYTQNGELNIIKMSTYGSYYTYFVGILIVVIEST